MRSRLRLRHLMAGSLLIAGLGCASAARSSFKQTDATFVPARGTAPAVYLYPSDVPKGPWRSVGIIAVTVPGDAGLTESIAVAVRRGTHVGCTALIEHSVFLHVRSRTWYGGAQGAYVRRFHGGGGSSSRAGAAVPSAGAESRPPETTQFDCVIAAPMPATVRSAMLHGSHDLRLRFGD